MKRNASFSPLGIASLVVIFAVLTLVVFAALSLSTAKAGLSLSSSAAEAVSASAEAEYSAQFILAQLRAGAVPDGVTGAGDVYSYSCPVNGSSAICVEVRVSGSDYELIRWQTVSLSASQDGDIIPVWQGS